MFGTLTHENVGKPKLVCITAFRPVADTDTESQYSNGNYQCANVIAVDIPSAIKKFNEANPEHVVTSATIENTHQIL